VADPGIAGTAASQGPSLAASALICAYLRLLFVVAVSVLIRVICGQKSFSVLLHEIVHYAKIAVCHNYSFSSGL